VFRTAPEPEKVLPRLPGGSAGKVLARALDAAGGWERWAAARDVSFVGTLTLLDRDRNLSSESIGWYMAPLHSGMRARMESIGMSSAITFGVNGNDTWIFRDGARVEDPARLAVTRFDLVSSLFWFSLPFSLAEIPATITDLGSRSEGAAQWDRLKVEFEGAAASVPGQWFVLYIDHGTGLIDHVHAQLTAPFLRHDLWVGKWLEYHDQAGLKKRTPARVLSGGQGRRDRRTRGGHPARRAHSPEQRVSGRAVRCASERRWRGPRPAFGS
jgi:hypothetical protein